MRCGPIEQPIAGLGCAEATVVLLDSRSGRRYSHVSVAVHLFRVVLSRAIRWFTLSAVGGAMSKLRLVAVLSFGSARPAEAQFGSLKDRIKQKAAEKVVKKAAETIDGKADSTAKASQSAAAGASTTSTASTAPTSR